MKKSTCVVGIDIGSYAIKIAGVRRAATPSLEFHTICEIPRGADEAFLSGRVQEILKQHNALKSQVFLTLSVESVNIRRIEMPPMAREDMREALKWKGKDRLLYDIDKAFFDFRVMGEIAKEDGSKALDVMLVACLKEDVYKKVNILKKVNLEVASVSVAPLTFENLLAIWGEIEPSKAIVVIDIGNAKTDISFYGSKMLHFVRSIPIAGASVTSALRNPIAGESGSMELTEEEAEELKKRVGIPYEPVKYDKKPVTSIQILTLIRGVLERFSKEVKRSIEYYTSEIGGASVSKVYLVGGGALLKNMDRYLNEELNLPVERLTLPKSIGDSKSAVGPEEAPVLAGAVGAALDYTRKIDLLPQEYRLEKVEFMQKVSLRLVTLIAGAALLVSYFMLQFTIRDYANRLELVKSHRGTIVTIEDLNSRIEERRKLIGAVGKTAFPYTAIMREISNLVPKEIVLQNLNIDPVSRTIDMQGLVYGGNERVEEVLTKFMEEMEKSPYFKEATMRSSLQPPPPGEDKLSFSISCLLR